MCQFPKWWQPLCKGRGRNSDFNIYKDPGTSYSHLPISALNGGCSPLLSRKTEAKDIPLGTPEVGSSPNWTVWNSPWAGSEFRPAGAARQTGELPEAEGRGQRAKTLGRDGWALTSVRGSRAVWLWVGCFLSLCFCFFICKMDISITKYDSIFLWVCCED